MEHPVYSVTDFYRMAKATTGILKALKKHRDGLQIHQTWAVLHMLAGELRKLADLIDDQVSKAEELEDLQRNGG